MSRPWIPDSPAVRRAAVAALLVVGVGLIAWLAAPRPSDGLPLSPTSSAADGTMALTEILTELGAEVVLEATPPEEADAGLLLVDNIPDADRDAWRELARRGGTLVVVDPGSPLAPDLVGETAFGLLDPPVGRACDVDALAGVARVQTGGGLTFDVSEDAVGCFPRGEGHWLVGRQEGDGAIVATGGPRFLVNDHIGEADNAVLAAALLAPRPGHVVAIAPPGLAAAEAELGLTDLIPDAAWIAMLQLLIAFLVVIWWRARRHGAPAVESQPVALPGSELVLGVGNLYQETGAVRHAAAQLREDARCTVATRLRLGARASAGEVAAAAEAAGVAPSLVAAALTGPLPNDDRGLVEFAGTVERLRAALDTIDNLEHEGAVRV